MLVIFIKFIFTFICLIAFAFTSVIMGFFLIVAAAVEGIQTLVSGGSVS